MNKKILVVGGHMAPAFGFIEALPKDVSVVYVGRKHAFEGDMGTSLEFETAKRLNIPFIVLNTGRLQRKITSRTIPSLAKLPKGFLQAMQILKQEKPDAVVCFGGYLSLPLGFAAAMKKIPVIVHESTFGAGLANRLLSSIASKICISSDSSRAYFPSRKTVITGNPMLPFSDGSIVEYLPKSKEKLPLLVVVGGSAGSHAINAIIEENLPQLLSFVRILHQTGDAKEYDDYNHLQKAIGRLEKKLGDRYNAVKFIEPEKVNAVLKAANLVVSRGGYNTIQTLLILKKKAIIIPLPYGQQNEQLENAKLFASSGFGLVMSQQDITSQSFIQSIKQMLVTKITETEHFSIPLYPNGAQNLVKEVLACLKHPTDA